jgi:hypothetical protein
MGNLSLEGLAGRHFAPPLLCLILPEPVVVTERAATFDPEALTLVAVSPCFYDEEIFCWLVAAVC